MTCVKCGRKVRGRPHPSLVCPNCRQLAVAAVTQARAAQVESTEQDDGADTEPVFASDGVQ